MIGVLLRFALARYLASPLYHGAIDESEPGRERAPVAAAPEEEPRARVKERPPIVPALNKPVTQE